MFYFIRNFKVYIVYLLYAYFILAIYPVSEASQVYREWKFLGGNKFIVKNSLDNKNQNKDYIDDKVDKSYDINTKVSLGGNLIETKYPDSCFALINNPSTSRDYLFIPLFSFFLPGLDQWWEGQYLYGALYSSIALASLKYSSFHYNNSSLNEDIIKDKYDTKKYNYNRTFHDERMRKINAGLQTYILSGGLSLYHSFRTAVRTRQKEGKFLFLTKEESIYDITTSSFKFSYLKRPSTFIPLSIGLVLMLYQQQAFNYKIKDKDFDMEKDFFTGTDAMYTALYSYNAGLWEEAVFRGWLLPIIYEWTDNVMISNIINAFTFALLHTDVEVPVIQFALGWYFGYLTSKNGWTIGENIFIHSWWDVLAFINIFQYKYKAKSAQTIYLAPLILYF